MFKFNEDTNFKKEEFTLIPKNLQHFKHCFSTSREFGDVDEFVQKQIASGFKTKITHDNQFLKVSMHELLANLYGLAIRGRSPLSPFAENFWFRSSGDLYSFR
ncbi:hypothetical protein Ciccas_009044 [Cichlidogyrus casuarinus]|uniref:Uncharacterized protein n=1 Tax=Cichlidogyrus casuarinus TaxID=1844966 RepID=A0ABD2PZ46_9PLAT